jgi:hypothetical protein
VTRRVEHPSHGSGGIGLADAGEDQIDVFAHGQEAPGFERLGDGNAQSSEQGLRFDGCGDNDKCAAWTRGGGLVLGRIG